MESQEYNNRFYIDWHFDDVRKKQIKFGGNALAQ